MAFYNGYFQNDGRYSSMNMYKYNIFLSYAHKDIEEVRSIYKFLRWIGITAFMDETERLLGDLPENLKKAIEQSQYFVFVQSNNTPTEYLVKETSYFMATRGYEKPLPFIRIRLSPGGSMPRELVSLDPGVDIDFEKSFIEGCSKLATHALQLGGESGILKYYPRNASIESDVWDMLIAKANQKIMLMGHVIKGTFSKDKAKIELVKTLKRLQSLNREVRIVLLTPNILKLQQLQEVQMNIHNNDVSLESRIKRTIEEIRNIKKGLNDYGEDSILRPRVTDRIMYSTIYLCDSLAIITNYSSVDEPGQNSPSFLVSDIEHNGKGLYSFYLGEFDRYWQGKNMHPEEERRKREFNDATRILVYRNQVTKIERWMRKKSTLPSPSLLVLYPTYQCFGANNSKNKIHLCDNCIYDAKRDSKEQIEIGLISKILEDAIKMGVGHIQFSGGGEPLQYDHLDELLSLLEKINSQNRELQLGLLTNGLWLNDTIKNRIASVFSYVRFSYAEGIIDNPNLGEKFLANLKGFLKVVANNATPRIGLKVLLSKQNAKDLAKKLVALREDKLGKKLFKRINHIRIKAMRSYEQDTEPNDEEDCSTFKYDFYDHLFVHPELWPEDTQLDLDLGYVQTDFHCIVSPLFALVDPSGSLMACYNYLNMYDDLKIGDLKTESLMNVWGSENHRQVVKKIKAELVCNAKNGCPCRFAKYQSILKNSSEGDSPSVPPEIACLL